MKDNFRTRVTLVIAGVILLLIGFMAGTAAIANIASAQTERAQATLQVSTMPVTLTEIEQIYAKVYDTVSPSVVAINVVTSAGLSGGSGFVIDRQGHIVTNYHVVQSANSIEVNFFDGTIARAETIGTDAASDLAVIKVSLEENRLNPVTFGFSEDLIIGQQVLAIGSPFGQRWTMTQGIVSALSRSISGVNTQFSTGGVIQTDTSINPGNSGGPLINLNGEVVGVNSQISTASGSNSGVGYAIPSELVQRAAQELIEKGRVDYAYIGIEGGSLSLTAMEMLNLPNDTKGVLVTRAVEGSPAARAGLRTAVREQETRRLISADIITAIDGYELNSMDALIAYLARNHKPGDQVTFTILRNGQPLDLLLTLGSRPN
jgi:S1-C subfamily serine protease